MSLNGWHPGERTIRQKLGLEKVPGTSLLYTYIDGDMPQQHSKFYCETLHFLPVVSLDSEGRPWGSVFTGRNGDIGFVKYPRYNTLSIEAKLWEGEPFWENSKGFHKEGELLVAGIGVEVATRRRNKFAGKVTRLKKNDLERVVSLDISVNQAIGNCPKYIVIRTLHPHPNTNPTVVHRNPHLSPKERLPDEVISFIHASDTVWFGTTYKASPLDSIAYPSHLGTNHRGGRPGFVRVRPSDGRTVVLPDFSGNRFMTSLGNVEATPLASLTIVDFLTGDILYLTGDAENLVGPAADAIMPFQDTITTIYVTGYTFVKDALPVRQKPLAEANQVSSPYSPPIKLLAEEISKSTTIFNVQDAELPVATLKKIDVHSPTIATFTFDSSVPLKITPGQAIILNFSTLFGTRQYQHMAPSKPSMVNDDFIRTWTVSSAHRASGTTEFQLTMKEKQGGAVTGALFNVANRLKKMKPHLLADTTELDLTAKVVGVSGDFLLDVEEAEKNAVNANQGERNERKLLWIAGGIGITPFLSMLKAFLDHSPSFPDIWDVTLVVSTREPEVIIPLLEEPFLRLSKDLGSSPTHLRFNVHVFSTNKAYRGSSSKNHSHFPLSYHNERLSRDFLNEQKEILVDGREAFVCGSGGFEQMVLDELKGLGVADVQREGFAY